MKRWRLLGLDERIRNAVYALLNTTVFYVAGRNNMQPSTLINGNTFQGYVNARLQNEVRTSANSTIQAVYRYLPLVVGYIQHFPFVRHDRYLVSLQYCTERVARSYFITYWQRELGIENTEALKQIWEGSVVGRETYRGIDRPVIVLENNDGITADGFIEAIYKVFEMKFHSDKTQG